MNSKSLLMIGGVLATTLLASWGFAESKAMQGRPTAIAVVDANKVLNSLEETNQIQADLKTATERVQAELQQKKIEVKQLEEDLGLLSPGTDAYKEKFEQFQLESIKLSAWVQFQEARLSREGVVRNASVNKKLLEDIEKVGNENGFDMVFLKGQRIQLRQPRNNKDKGAIAEVRIVLWSKSDLDLTDQVTLRMNNEWKNSR